MKTKDEVIDGFMERHCAMSSKKGYNTIKSQLAGIWNNGRQTGIDEAYEAFRDVEAYQRGLTDAWETVKTLDSLDQWDASNLVGFEVVNYSDWLAHSPQEIVEKCKAWKEKKAKAEAEAEEEIRVGDEVVERSGTTFTVTQIIDDSVYGIGQSGCFEGEYKQDLHKTGRHFDQVEQLLKEMRENT